MSNLDTHHHDAHPSAVADMTVHVPMPNLSRPPIQEAVLEASFIGSAISVETLRDFRSTLPDEFDEEQVVQEITLTVNPLTSTAGRPHTPVGLIFKNSSNGRGLILKPRTISVTRGPGYTDWDEFSLDFCEKVAAFAKHFSLIRLSKISTRFVNRIVVNESSVELDDWLLTAPIVPKGLGGDIVRFESTIVVQLEQKSIAVVIKNSSGRPSAENETSFIIDIDAICQLDEEFRSEVFERVLPALRSAKNSAFFGSLPDRVVRRYL